MEPTADNEPATEPTKPTVKDPERRSSWWVVMLGAVFVIGVAATLSYIMSEDSEERKNGTNEPTFVEGFFDDFNHPASSEQLAVPGGLEWVSNAGVWGLQVGVAFIATPDPKLNVVVTEARTSSVSISAHVGGTGVCGIVARYSDNQNYTALVRAPGYAVWNIVEMVGGVERVVATVPDVSDYIVGVNLTVGDDVIAVTVGLNHIDVIERSTLRGTNVGLIGQQEFAGTCTWDNFVVQEAN